MAQYLDKEGLKEFWKGIKYYYGTPITLPAYTTSTSTSSISGSGGTGTIYIPQVTIDTYGRVTSISDKAVRFTLPTIPGCLPNQYALKFGSKSYTGAKEETITLADLGLTNALIYKGITTTDIKDGDTTNPIIINNTSTVVSTGNIVIKNNKEYIWNGSYWEELGDESAYKVKQSPVQDSTISTSGNSIVFISQLSQNENGDITALKSTIPTVTSNGNGLMTPALLNKLNNITSEATKVSIGNLATSGTTLATLTINGTPYDLKYTNTDVSVKQTATASNNSYPILLSALGHISGNAGVTYYDSEVTLNPSTNTINANIAGTAVRATIADSATTANNALALNGKDSTAFLEKVGGIMSGPLTIKGPHDTKLIFDNTDGEGISLISFRENGVTRGDLGVIGSNILYWNNDKVLTSSNYTSYSPKLDGTGASGTWKIKINDISNHIVEDVHYSNDSNKVVSAKQTWEELDKRNVAFEAGIDIPEYINMSEEEFLAKNTYGIGWETNASTCVMVGNESLIRDMPIHKSLKGCVNQIINTPVIVSEKGYTIEYSAQRRFLYWLDPNDWTKKTDGTPSTLDGSNNTNISVYNCRFYYKSFENIASSYNHTSSGTWREVRLSLIKFDNTWTEFKEGYTDFSKMQVVNNVARCYGNPNFSIPNPRDYSLTPTEINTWITTCNIPKSGVDINRATAHQYALNSGAHLLSYDEYKILFYWLPAIEFCTFEIESNSVFEWQWSGHTVDRESISVNYGYPGLFHSSYNVLGFTGIVSGLTHNLGNNTGWVKFNFPTDSSGTSTTPICIIRYRGLENLATRTNAYGVWGMQTTSNNCEIFSTSNRAIWNNSVPLQNVSTTTAIDLYNGSNYSLIDVDIKYCGRQSYAENNMFIGEWTIKNCAELVPMECSSYKRKGDITQGNAKLNRTNPRWYVLGGSLYSDSYDGPGFISTYYDTSFYTSGTSFRCRYNVDEYTSIYN